MLIADEVYQTNIYAAGKEFFSFKKASRRKNRDAAWRLKGGGIKACHAHSAALQAALSAASSPEAACIPALPPSPLPTLPAVDSPWPCRRC